MVSLMRSTTPLIAAAVAALTLPVMALAFSDVDSNNPHASAIAYVQSKGIVSGYPDGSYRPNAVINRAEFTKIIIGAYFADQVQSCNVATLHFSDIDVTAWYAPYLCVAVEKGVIAGYPDGTYRPNATINFAEAAKIIAVSDMGMAMSSANSGPWYQPYVTYLSEKHANAGIEAVGHMLMRGEMAEVIFDLKAGAGMTSSAEASSMAASSEAATSNQVTIEDYDFSPADITVKAGTTVTWTNHGQIQHTVTGDHNAGPNSSLLGAGQSYSFTFASAGSFPYHCSIHPGMKGTVTVTP